MKDDVKLLAQAACTAIPFVLTADEQTLSRYAHRMTDAGHTQVQAIVLSAGFDPSWFQDGQGSLLGH